MPNEPDRTLDALSACLQACGERASRQGFSFGEPQHAAAVSLLGSILELAADVLDLLKRGKAIAPKILLRSLLEAFVELVNVTEDPDYLGSMRYAQLVALQKLVNVATGPDQAQNPFFADLLSNEATAERRAEIALELAELESQGIRELNIWARFKLAGERDRYEAIYRLLSQQAHHSLNALGDRHVVEQEGQPALVFFKKEERQQVLAEADQVAGVATNAVALVSSLVDGVETNMQPVSDLLEAFRALMREELQGASLG